jgi:peroxiredoxin
MSMKATKLFSLIAVGVFGLGLFAANPLVNAEPGKQADQPKHKETAPKPRASDWEPLVKPGDKAPDFELRDLDGKTFKLSEALKNHKAVVLEWFNPDCPFVVKHHKNNPTFANLHKEFAPKGVLFVAINSGAPGEQGAGKDRNVKARSDFKMEYQILLDESGTVGRLYGARTTPQMVIILPDGKVAYHGAIDNNSSADKLGDVNYVSKALNEILSGTSVSITTSRPYGCSVKYGRARAN